MIMSFGLPLITAGIAMLMDFRRARIDNMWLAFMLILGFASRILSEGWHMIPSFAAGLVFPFLLLAILFVFRMLGAGDIKLFCVLGSMIGVRNILHCILASFVIGGVISLLVMISGGLFRERLRYLKAYFFRIFYLGQVEPYLRKGMEAENIHFTVPVFLSLVLCAGGVI